MTREAPFARLLRWYPRRWRELHGEVLLASMLEEAERTGRTVPTSEERRSAAVHGLASRLDGRTAVLLGAAGLGISIVEVLATMFLPGGAPNWTLILFTAGLAPSLTLVALVALSRGWGVISDPRTLILAVFAIVTPSLGAVASVSWSLGFDAADAGRPVTGLAAAWLPIIGVALLFAAVGIAVLLEALLARAGFTRSGAIALAAFTGLVGAPIAGYAMLTSASVGVVALLVMVAAIIPRRRRPDTTATAASSPPQVSSLRNEAPAASLSRTRLAAARALLALSVGTGLFGATWALAGSLAPFTSADATETMRQGIAILCVSGLPLLLGSAFLAPPSADRHPANVWGPAGSAAAGLVVLCVDYASGSGAGDITLGMVMSAVLIGAAVGWWTAASLAIAMPLRILVGVSAAVAYAVLMGIMLTALLVFVVPIVAIVMLVRTRPRGQRSSLHGGGSATPVRSS